MERFSRSEYEFCASLLKSGVLNVDLRKMVFHLNAILDNCHIDSNDGFVDKVFKSFVVCQDIGKVFLKYNNCKSIKQRDDILDIIVYRQSSNIDLTLLAKIIYRKYGKFYKDWLDWQIDKLLNSEHVNLEDEYIAYSHNNGEQYDRHLDIFTKHF